MHKAKLIPRQLDKPTIDYLGGYQSPLMPSAFGEIFI
jgi:hypothetical protein